MKVYVLFGWERGNEDENSIRVFYGVFSSREKAEKVSQGIWADIEEIEIDERIN